MTTEPNTTSEGVPVASIASRAAFRLVAQAATATGALLTGIVVARRLGSDGKGIVSTLSYLVALAVPLAALGLGEAGVTLVRRHGEDFGRAARATIGALMVSAIALSGLVALAGWLLYHDQWGELRDPVLAAAVSVLPAAAAYVLSNLFEAQQRPVLTSAARTVAAVGMVVATAGAVLGYRMGPAGAVAAIGLGWAAGLAVLVIALVRLDIPPLPTADGAYLRRALRLGIPVQIASFLVVAASRADLLPVQAISGDVVAGYYSVSLTVGSLVTWVPSALAVAAYPRVAGLPVDASADEIARVTRMSVLVAAVAGAGLCLAVPILIPLAFGAGFRSAVGPAEVLVIGGVLASAQLVLARLLAADAQPSALLVSYAVSLTVMLTLDLAFVPSFGAAGAACASVSSSAVGLGVAGLRFRAAHRETALRAFVPGRADAVAIVQRLRGAARSRWPGRAA